VTGAGSGIGRAVVQALLAAGYRVAAGDLDEAAAQESLRLAGASAGQAFALRVDVTRDADCRALVAQTVERFGRLDAAFNNAGVPGHPAFTVDYEPALWQQVLDVNLTGVFLCLRHEIAAMQAGGGGAIVNTASTMGLRGSAGGAAYCASKHGVVGLTKAAALECGRHGIRINAICPGYVDTPMTTGPDTIFPAQKLENGVRQTALRRMARPQEVAAVVLWLLSPSASYVTGASYTVDAGLTAA